MYSEVYQKYAEIKYSAKKKTLLRPKISSIIEIMSDITISIHINMMVQKPVKIFIKK